MSSAWIFDLDGVVWRGKVPIKGSVETIKRLCDRGDRVLFASNNSSLTVEAYQQKFSDFGLTVAAENIVTSAQAAATLVLASARVLVVGGAGILEALANRGVNATMVADVPDGQDATGFDTVMVGLDIEFDYRRFQVATRAVLAGARLIATNQDPTYPAADGMNPGGGSIAAAIAYAGGQSAEFAGKPHQPMADVITARLGGVGATAMVGDQPLTDGGLARTLGIPFWMVLSGVASSSEGADPSPERCANDVESLFSDR